MTTIRKLLIANRGEIARRIIRTARRMGIATVAVFSDPDAEAPHVEEADEAVALPGSAAADTYLRAHLLIEAGRRTRADAVHPGYGFLSENADFARACEGAGITFVGPTPDVIERMGSKIEAKRIMASAGVPVLPGFTIAAQKPSELVAAAGAIGFPLLVKAAFGGGGRGMRLVKADADLVSAVESARREAAAAFGDGTLLVERFVESPRHVEVQIIGDHHGGVAHLYERECSIQRRHQKIIEEAPSPAVDPALRSELCAAALTAAEAIGYVSAGTVEFVLAPDGDFWFLEVNTRLQVEHPVTEAITGLDLVELQLLVAQGHSLPDEARNPKLSGHAIEARLYAEDVSDDYRPTSGRVHRVRIADRQSVRVDSGYVDGSNVSPFYDAMLAKVISWAPTRAEAAYELAESLSHAQLHGPVTNRELLVRTLRHADFLNGRADTTFLETNDAAAMGAPLADSEAQLLHAAAAALSVREARRRASPMPRGIPAGWRNVGPADQPIVFECTGERLEVTCREVQGRLAIAINDAEFDEPVLWSASDELVDLTVAGVRRRYDVQTVGRIHYVDSALGASALTEEERFPEPQIVTPTGSLVSPLPGMVVQIVREGDEVRAGDSLVTLEAMKMEHPVRAPKDGIVASVCVSVGDQVDTGTVLVVIKAGTDGD